MLEVVQLSRERESVARRRSSRRCSKVPPTHSRRTPGTARTAQRGGGRTWGPGGEADDLGSEGVDGQPHEGGAAEEQRGLEAPEGADPHDGQRGGGGEHR